nr:RNA-directed DNA polymerase, eukaryota [Tanacetum cinerariifolium]
MKANGDTLTPESNNLDTMTIDELHGSLLVHEQRMIGQQEDEQALKITIGSSFRGRGRGRGGSSRGRRRGRGRSSFDKSTIECYNCHKVGHFQNDGGSTKQGIWFLDSGCSNHMTGEKKWFCSFDDSYRNNVRLGNNLRVAAMGRGNVRLDIEGIIHTLSDVYFVHDLTNNLISVSQAQESGVKILIKRGTCSIFHPKRGLVTRIQMSSNRMFLIKAKPSCNGECHKVETDGASLLWHQRFGHINNKSLNVLYDKGLVKGLPTITAELEMSQALETFKKFKTLVEKEAGAEIKCLRTDRGGEFNSREFNPTSALENNTPEERWSNRKPSVSYFRVFGCIAHVHVPKERRLKLDDRSFKYVLFGVSEEAKAYRLYDPTTKRIIISKDVIFEEDVSWNWSQESEIEPSDLEWEDNVEQKDDEVGAGLSEIANEPLNDSTGPNNSAGSSSGNESRPSSVNPIRATTNERERRQTRAPTWMQDYGHWRRAEPTNYHDAAQEKCWRHAIKLEIEAIEKNNTWELCDLPSNATAIGVKWVFGVVKEDALAYWSNSRRRFGSKDQTNRNMEANKGHSTNGFKVGNKSDGSYAHVVNGGFPSEVDQDFVSEERIAWVDIEGVPIRAWSVETFSRIGKNGEEGEFKSNDVEGVAETIFGGNSVLDKHHSEEPVTQESGDPFKIFEVLNKNKSRVEPRVSSPSLSHPPGFSPNDAKFVKSPQLVRMEGSSGSVRQSVESKGGSILGVLEEETKMDTMSHMDVKFMWGNSNYDFVCSDSLGSSGGILCIWESSIIKKDNVTISDNFIAIYGIWLTNNVKVLLISIYAPQQPAYKRVLWEYLSTLLGRWNGEVIVMGDFNEVRRKEERRGSVFNQAGARFFNQFITTSGLVDVKMEGFSFTWSHPSAMKMSKLDRFLVSDGIILLFPSITTFCLDQHISDHRPILLREILLDFGPTPFQFYHSWFSYNGFDEMVEKTWRSFSYLDTNRMIRFKKKLQELKSSIRLWVKDKRANLSGLKYDIASELCEIDKELDSGLVSDDQLARRLDLKGQLYDINDKEVSDHFQKSKVRWAIKGDENSSFFHGIINKKRSQLGIRGILVDCSWQSDPRVVKESAFVSERQILDGPFIIIELLHWCKRKNKRAMFFKVDFAKAVVEASIFKGIRLNSSLSLSHLFYADDALIIGEWSIDNLRGGNMSRCKASSDIVSKLRSRLSKWKTKTLSIGGRLTLLKSVLGASPLYCMSIFKAPKGVLKEMESIRNKFFIGADNLDKKITWVAWDKVLASKKNGGL